MGVLLFFEWNEQLVSALVFYTDLVTSGSKVSNGLRILRNVSNVSCQFAVLPAFLQSGH